MKIGFDYWETLTDLSILKLAKTLNTSWNELYIISAVGPFRIKTQQAEIEKFVETYKLNVKRIEIIPFKSPHEVPELKLEICNQYGIELFIENRLDVCRFLIDNGIPTLLKVKKTDHSFDYQNPNNSRYPNNFRR